VTATGPVPSTSDVSESLGLDDDSQTEVVVFIVRNSSATVTLAADESADTPEQADAAHATLDAAYCAGADGCEVTLVIISAPEDGGGGESGSGSTEEQDGGADGDDEAAARSRRRLAEALAALRRALAGEDLVAELTVTEALPDGSAGPLDLSADALGESLGPDQTVIASAPAAPLVVRPPRRR